MTVEDLMAVGNAEEREEKVMKEFGVSRLQQDFKHLPEVKLLAEGSVHSLKGTL